MFWARLRLILALAIVLHLLKMSAEKGPKYIYAEEHQLYYYYYNFEEHLVQKQEHFATSETRMTRWLRPAGSNMLEPAKMFIRARIIRHNARQSYNNLLYKTNRFHVAARLFSNRSQMTSKCSENITDTLGYRLVGHVFCSCHI